MSIRSFLASKRRRRLAYGGIAMLACLFVADPAYTLGRFGGRGFSRGMRGGGSFGGGGFGGGGMRGGGYSRAGGFGAGYRSPATRVSPDDRHANPENVESRQAGRSDRTGSRQEGASDRTDTRNKTAKQISDNREDAWNHTVDHWGGASYWGHSYWETANAGAAFVGGMALGAAVASLPARYETVVVAGAPYYYADGVYYMESDSGYTVIPAPVGAVVEHPPAQVTNVYVDDQDLGYSNGAYYEQQPPAEPGADPSYKVVAPPIGATVTSVPKGAKQTTIGGIEYYVYARTYYQVFHSGSTVVYRVVKDPTG